MLSVRSKVVVTVAIVVMLTFLLGYVMESSLDPGDWDGEWTVAGIFFAIAIVSIIVDVRRSRSPS
jgi:hypothetical protein